MPSNHRGKIMSSLSYKLENTLGTDKFVLDTVINWCKEYLLVPHKLLGRSGSVCPFMAKAIKSESVKFHVEHLSNTQKNEKTISEIIKRHRSKFLKLPSKGRLALFDSDVIIFPDLTTDDEISLLKQSQGTLKKSFIENGLMIGDFHRLNTIKAIHNSSFEPLKSPVPLMAIRRMTKFDEVFLEKGTESRKDLQEHLEIFRDRFPDGANFSEQRTNPIARPL
jgi:hypothetical protein